ncbi:MAG TPA: O-antigen ligase family protein [Candidatus Latescibacteria bacterium]|nr:O-antigen ligase family protein [Candidatus Latescibacterota bacterium]HJP33163.1 O-antigen ligase family protein [Candidatus Latescibacterota bacterium]
MTDLASRYPRLMPPPLDRRLFVLFITLQIIVAIAAFYLPSKLFAIAALGIGAGLYLVGVLMWPWIIVPAVVVTTALDITGQLIKETGIGIPVTGFHLSLMLMTIGIFTNTCLRRRFTFPTFELKAPLFLLWGTMAFSLTYTPALAEGTVGVMRTLALMAFLYGTQVMIDTRRAVNLVVISMAAAMIGGAILAVAQIMSEKFYLPASFVIAVGANAPRATGTFHNPNTFGTFLMCGVVFLFALLVNHRFRKWQAVYLLASLAAAGAGLITTFSRSNWVAAAIGIVAAMIYARKFRYLLWVGLGGFAAIFAVKEFVPFADHIFQRFVSIFTLLTDFGDAGRESGSARLYFIIAGLEMWLDHPILGAGWRAFPLLFDAYKPVDFPMWVPTKESHTLAANMLAELGLVGITASVWIVWRVLRRGIETVGQTADPYLRAVLIALLCVFLSFQVSLSATADFSNNFLWFFTGMIFAVIHLSERETAAASG